MLLSEVFTSYKVILYLLKIMKSWKNKTNFIACVGKFYNAFNFAIPVAILGLIKVILPNMEIFKNINNLVTINCN